MPRAIPGDVGKLYREEASPASPTDDRALAPLGSPHRRLARLDPDPPDEYDVARRVAQWASRLGVVDLLEGALAQA